MPGCSQMQDRISSINPMKNLAAVQLRLVDQVIGQRSIRAKQCLYPRAIIIVYRFKDPLLTHRDDNNSSRAQKTTS